MSGITGFLANLNRLGFRFWIENETLKFSVPKGILDHTLKAQLRARKAEIIAFLKDHQRSNVPVPPLQKTRHEGPYPLSFAQQRLWFLYQLEPHSAVYNLPTAIRILGRIEVPILERAINRLAARHDVLRTRFFEEDGHPFQVPRETLAITLAQESMADLTKDEAEAKVRQRIVDEGRLPFNLCEEPLIRFLLFKLEAEAHILFLNVHHIISDFWSIKLFFQELGDAYQALAIGGGMEIPEPEFQFRDFVHWQKTWLATEKLEELRRFWVQTLSGAPFYLELPYDLPRPSQQSIRGRRVPVQIHQPTTSLLNDLAHRSKASLFMVTLAMFQILLRWFSGKNDLVIGSDVANRNHDGMQRLQGFFVNQLVLRAQMNDQHSFETYLDLVRRHTLAAHQHQDFPFDGLVEALNPPRGNFSPIFQTKFIFQNVPPQPFNDRTGLQFEVFEPQRGTAQVDLLLVLSQSQQGLEGSLEYCTDLFLERTALRLAAHYQSLAAEISKDPGLTLGALTGLLNEADKSLRKQQRPKFRKPGFKDKPLKSRFSAEKKPHPITVTQT